MKRVMTVKQLAQAAGMAPHTVRYYVRLGLLRPARDPVNGYKLFGEHDVLRLRLVRQAQALGLTLKEIQDVLEACEGGGSARAAMMAVSRRRLRETEQALASLQRMRQRLERAVRLWERGPGPELQGLQGLSRLLEQVGREAEAEGGERIP